MSERRVELLALTVIGPDLPPPTHLRLPIHVCFCGRPLPRWVDGRWIGGRCPECGWGHSLPLVDPVLDELVEREMERRVGVHPLGRLRPPVVRGRARR